jgi:putative flippase GtrA
MTPDRLRSLLADRQFLRFLVAGGVNTLFGFGVNIAALLSGMPVWLAMLVGTVAGVVFNFFTHGGYAFRDMSARRLPRYVLGYAIVYLVGLGAFEALHLAVDGVIVCQVMLVIPMALFSYLVMSRFVFHKRRGR